MVRLASATKSPVTNLTIESVLASVPHPFLTSGIVSISAKTPITEDLKGFGGRYRADASQWQGWHRLPDAIG
jgi:hypothetical protein